MMLICLTFELCRHPRLAGYIFNGEHWSDMLIFLLTMSPYFKLTNL